jgi:hypothetical protein
LVLMWILSFEVFMNMVTRKGRRSLEYMVHFDIVFLMFNILAQSLKTNREILHTDGK